MATPVQMWPEGWSGLLDSVFLIKEPLDQFLQV